MCVGGSGCWWGNGVLGFGRVGDGVMGVVGSWWWWWCWGCGGGGGGGVVVVVVVVRPLVEDGVNCFVGGMIGGNTMVNK